MNYSIFDIEATGLIENVTKIHCLAYSRYIDGRIENGVITDYNEMVSFFDNESTIIGHNIIKYDIPVVEKILGIKYQGRQIDTLGLSWYLYPNKLVHGLEEWGQVFNIEKPKIMDWVNGSVEDYKHRCSEDVRINVKLWDLELEYLKRIYKNDSHAIDRIIGYLGYKLQCAREQEEVKMKLDVAKCKANLEFLTEKSMAKVEILSEIMPLQNVYKIHAKPKVMYKKDGSISALGEKWLKLLEENNLPAYHNGALKLVSDTKKGNPASPSQKKDWLFSLGWQPITFKYVKDKDTPYSKETPPRKVPQLTSDDDTGLCQSVKDLFEKEPQLVELEDYTIINHRIGILNGFLDSIDENGFLKAEISGFTNTLRFKHKMPICNLPTIPKLYWEKVRECLIAPDDNHILCGSDMASLEDSTKRHYMYYYDPKYVEEMMVEGFCPHLDIAIKAKLLNEDDVLFFKKFDKAVDMDIKSLFKYASIKATRLKAKKTNFAAVYGAGGPKIAVTANVSEKEGYIFHKVYWDRNWSVKKIAADVKWKKIDGQMWLFNPVSQFWYSLRYDKDKFSTLNQGTGVYAFDMWIKECRNRGYKICMQYHDEHVSPRLKGTEEETRKILLDAIKEVNNKLKLNITLGISIDMGNTYADIH